MKFVFPSARTRTRTRTRARRVAGAVVVALVCASLPPSAGWAAPGESAPPGPTPAGPTGPVGVPPGTDLSAGGEPVADFDARADGPARAALDARRADLAARPPRAVRDLRQSLGRQGIVDIDPLTATPRRVARLDGFLTGPSRRPATEIALDYLRGHAEAFGLTADTVATLGLRQDYRDVAGTHHLSFTQRVDGVPVFGNGVRVHVSATGRVIQVDGSPLRTPPADAGTADLTAERARDAAVADAGGDDPAAPVATRDPGPTRQTTFTDGDRAQLVIFHTLSGPRLAWQTITLAEGNLHVLDARTGRVLYRQSLVAHDSGLVWSNYAGAPRGGQQRRRNFTAAGWLPAGSPRLAGNVAHVYTDVDDDDLADPGEEVRPGGVRRFDYPFTDFTAEVGQPCSAGFQCSWNPQVPGSWKANREQNATQLFHFLGTFHDHLLAKPIGFTRTAGNFEAVDGDAVRGEALDGADLAGGLPDAAHVDNANMTTPPDGLPPRMQMYLFDAPGANKYLSATSATTADIVYHEYTHGLSSRLVVDAAGVSTLGAIQAGAMGEGWSDWYALDYLVGAGLETDTTAPGEVRMGKFVKAGGTIRTAPIDCPVGTLVPECPGGGYTYGDFAKIAGTAQPHADGEIWGQTLWDLRTALGSRLTRSLLTRAMELSPANPSYLDMRNSIIQADLVVNRGRAGAAIWRVFAARGMGWFAAALDGDDTAPAEDFALPPAPDTPRVTLTGRVLDTDTGEPVAGAVVGFGGHSSGFAGGYAASTSADGTYTISGVLTGTYPKMFARAAGYDVATRTVPVAAEPGALDWSVRRDWASAAGGARVVDADGVADADSGCGPTALVDQSQGTGWSTDARYGPDGVMEPRAIVLALPAPVDLLDVLINPSATCAHSASAGTSRYRLETSPDGVAWTEANAGDFGLSHRKKMNRIPVAAGAGTGVRFLRYTMLSTQVEDMAGSCPGSYSGCYYADSVELAVYGTAAGR